MSQIFKINTLQQPWTHFRTPFLLFFPEDSKYRESTVSLLWMFWELYICLHLGTTCTRAWHLKKNSQLILLFNYWYTVLHSFSLLKIFNCVDTLLFTNQVSSFVLFQAATMNILKYDSMSIVPRVKLSLRYLFACEIAVWECKLSALPDIAQNLQICRNNFYCH